MSVKQSHEAVEKFLPRRLKDEMVVSKVMSVYTSQIRTSNNGHMVTRVKREHELRLLRKWGPTNSSIECLPLPMFAIAMAKVWRNLSGHTPDVAME